MSETLDLRQIQKRTIQMMSFEDGLWDLLLGSMFIFLATYPVTRELLGPEWNLALFLALLASITVIHLVVRRIVSQPRIGYAASRRTRKVWVLLGFTIVMVLITIGMVALTFFSPVPETASTAPSQDAASRGYLVELIVVLVMGGLFSAMGYIFGVPRLYFYGWMLGLANLASVYMKHNAGWLFQIPLAITAVIILVIGILRLNRFLQKYPVRAEEP